MAQYLRPDSTVDNGSWTGDYTNVDEVTPNDADYTETNKVASTHQMTLSSPAATPDSGTCTVSWRGRRRLTNKSAEVTIEIWNGTTAMVSGATETKTDPSGTFTTWSTLTFSTADVTSWSDLQVRLVASPTPAVDFDVSWIQVEVPDGPMTYQDSGADTAEFTDSATTVLTATESASDTVDLTDTGTVPTGPLVWNETFETTGYDNTWSEGETVAGSAVLDSDFATSSVTGAPAWWDDKCLKLAASAGDDSYVLHYGWGGGSDGLPISYTSIECILESESLANSDIGHWLSARDSETEKIYQWMVYRSGSGELRLEAQIWYDGTSSNFETIQVTPSLDTVYQVEMKWDITNEAWELRCNDTYIAGGSITGEGLNRPVDGCFLGDIGTQQDADYVIYLDNFQVRTDTWVGPMGGLTGAGSDTADLTDSATTTLTATESGSETADLSDTGTGSLTMPVSGTETTDLTDSAVAGLLSSESGADQADLSDSAVGDVKLVETGADQADLSESTSTVLTAVESLSETADLSDTGSVVLQATESGSETAELSDTGSGVLLGLESGSDTVELTDSAADVLTSPISGSEQVELSDSAVTVLTAVQSVSDTVDLSDVGTYPDGELYSTCRIIFGS